MTEMTNIITELNELSIPDKYEQRKAIVRLEDELLKHEQKEVPLTDLTHAGMYTRAILLEKDTLATGHIHKYDHIEIIASGKVAVTTDDGQCKIYEGFNVLPAFSGKKRAAYAIENTVYVTVDCVGNTGDLSNDQIKDALIVGDFDELDHFYTKVNQADYELFVRESGLTHEQWAAIVHNENDQVTIDIEALGLYKSESDIHGFGLFASRKIQQGENIGIGRIDNKRTQLGRFINHAVRPNCMFAYDGEVIVCVAIEPISKGQELTVNYRAEVKGLQGVEHE